MSSHSTEPAHFADGAARLAATDAKQDGHTAAYIYGFDSGGNPTLTDAGDSSSSSAGGGPAPASPSE